MFSPRNIEDPQICFRQIKVTKGGVWVPARIHRTCRCTPNGGDESAPHEWRDSCDRYPHLQGEVEGQPAGVNYIWTTGQSIEEHEYRYLMADHVHARNHRPDSPQANPDRTVDFNTLAPPLWRE